MIPLYFTGGPEIVILLVLVFILFYLGSLVDSAKAAGQSIGEFKDGVKEGAEEMEELVQIDDNSSGTELSDEVSDSSSDPVDVVSGIGETYRDRLESEGVETVYDLANTPPSEIAEFAEVKESQGVEWVNEATEYIANDPISDDDDE